MPDIVVNNDHQPPLEIVEVRELCVRDTIPHEIDFHDVTPFEKKTPSAKTLAYVSNAAGLTYNPEYAGFGIISLGKPPALPGVYDFSPTRLTSY